jgi:NAD-dependent deacetylase
MKKRNLVIFTGAGISAQSGLKTFRDSDGLWEGYNVQEVASPEGFAKMPYKVLDFYNMRRAQLGEVEPNEAHKICFKLEELFDVKVITQNVDDLHERAGSRNILHLHGQLRSVRCTHNCFQKIIDYGPINVGDTCPSGHQLRPDIVWFGEEVPAMDEAINWVQSSDVFVVIGTSLQVYPAASLLHFATGPVYIIDPSMHQNMANHQIIVINKDAVNGTQELYKILSRFVA